MRQNNFRLLQVNFHRIISLEIYPLIWDLIPRVFHGEERLVQPFSMPPEYRYWLGKKGLISPTMFEAYRWEEKMIHIDFLCFRINLRYWRKTEWYDCIDKDGNVIDKEFLKDQQESKDNLRFKEFDPDAAERHRTK